MIRRGIRKNAFDVRGSTFDVERHRDSLVVPFTQELTTEKSSRLQTSNVERRTSNHIFRLIALGLAVIALTALSGCYRLRRPVDLGQPVRVEITVNDTRLVRAQAYLQQAVADALASQLGWKVTPNGSAALRLTIEQEDITSTGTNQRDTPNRWTIILNGQIMLTSRQGNALGTWTGSGYASALSSAGDDEASALKNAASNAALTISAWLEAQVRAWPEMRPSP